MKLEKLYEVCSDLPTDWSVELLASVLAPALGGEYRYPATVPEWVVAGHSSGLNFSSDRFEEFVISEVKWDDHILYLSRMEGGYLVDLYRRREAHIYLYEGFMGNPLPARELIWQLANLSERFPEAIQLRRAA